VEAKPLVQLVILVIFGAICALVARSKGRNAFGWFFAGFFGGLIGLIIILVIGDARGDMRHRARADRERRLLREQLRQERLKNESFRRHSTARLDRHDRSLGMNTRQAGGMPQALPGAPASRGGAGGAGRLTGGAPAGAAPEASGGGPPPVSAQKEWYYEIEGEPKGPVPAAEIESLLRRRQLGSTTLVWHDGLDDWVPAGRTPAFRAIFRK